MILASLFSTLLIITSAATEVISFAPTVLVRGDVVRLADVADVSILPKDWRDAAAKLPLMKLPRNTHPIMLRKSDLASRTRSLMPMLAPWIGAPDGIVIIRRREDDPMRLVAKATQDEGIAKNDLVRVSIDIGAFTVERQGVAMSGAKIGERLFVKTIDHKALSAICCAK